MSAVPLTSEELHNLTHEGALLWVLNTLLNGDAHLRAEGNGAFLRRADADTKTPFLTYYPMSAYRERTLPGEAFRVIPFVIKATWDDRAGINYLYGDRLMNRVLFLLDGAQDTGGASSAMPRVCEFLNSQLSLAGYYAMGCALQTDLPTGDEYIGDSATGRSNRGGLFHLHLRRAQ